MSVPKVIFKYSQIYDDFLKSMRKDKNEKYPSRKDILDFRKRFEGAWIKEEKRVLKEISKITGLEWEEKFIYCYLVAEGDFSLSDPMTLVIYREGAFKDLEFLIDNLVHETIHRIFSEKENLKACQKSWEWVNNNYKGETRKTKIHILVHAVHNHIYLEIYNKKRLNRDIEWAQEHKDYRRAWELVQREGYDKIIKEFRERINE